MEKLGWCFMLNRWLRADATRWMHSSFYDAFFKISWVLFAALLAWQVQAIERDQVAASHVVQASSALSFEQTVYPERLKESYIRSVINARYQGEFFSLEQLKGTLADGQGQAILRLPLALERFTQGELSIKGADKVTFYVGELGEVAAKASWDLALQTGDYDVYAFLEGVKNWDDVQVDWQGKSDSDQLHYRSQALKRLTPHAMFDAPSRSIVALAPDASQVIWKTTQFQETTGNKSQQETELYDVNAKKVVYRWSTGAYGHTWSPDSQAIAYIENQRVYQYQVKTGELTALTEPYAGVSVLKWLDNQQLLLSLQKKGQDDGDKVKRYQALQDRWSYYRDVSHVYLLDAQTGVLQQLTEGEQSHSLQDADPKGKKLLVSYSIVDYSKPPHGKTALYELDLTTGKKLSLGEHWTLNRAIYGQDGIYVIAGPDFMDGVGRALPQGRLANNYDGQLYRLDREGQATALSVDFDPAIQSVRHAGQAGLLLSVTEKDTTQLYLYSPKQKTYKKVATQAEIVSSFALASQTDFHLYYVGQSAAQPEFLAHLHSVDATPEILWDSANYFDDRVISPVKDWDFMNDQGDTISGRVYLPPYLDTNKKYPALVYYYGGTTPVQRGFTGRYPFQQWAAQGYVVYVLQPSGSIGFGQEFSARHVNAWGDYTAKEIIQGTKAFLNAHPFVDANKVGHLGASYGGFMTMFLATMTDIYSASMSHAGISNLTSYWGEGWWGYGYSGEASKGSFPWNNPQLYTEHSPVYHADKVTAPMLLIHGDGDTNVPPGESHTMYTALKLLDKPVELIEFKGEDHHIIPRDMRLLWWDTYMAFFDKHLKGEPQWWDYLYPEK